MISGITLSYFTDISDASEIHFTTGKVEVDIAETISDDNWDDWKPGVGNAKSINWKFVNSGTMDSYLKVMINTSWEEDGVTFPEGPLVTWVQTGDSAWQYKDGYWYYPAAIAPGDNVALSFDFHITTIQGYRGADYKITLTVEAVQADNNTSLEWN
jgi:hypothetical protein